MNADSFILGFAAINYLILIILLLVIYKKKIKIPDHVKKTSKFLLFAFLFTWSGLLSFNPAAFWFPVLTKRKRAVFIIRRPSEASLS